MLKIYNTLGKKLEDFVPHQAGIVTIYVCGPTVYDYLHVGNFRGPVFFNFVRNWFEYLGYKVTYALNYTDVEDKIIQRAIKENKTPAEISERYIQEYQKDFHTLELRDHDYNPKVTDHMPGIIKMISDLIEKKKAYTAAVSATVADVNFSISEFPDYGKLSGRKPEDMQSGIRIDVDEKKKNPLDFALWKAAKPNEVSWSSPWGPGRPGWHIECSAMVKDLFGNQIDIHGGGLDLMFPHHENEIAQSEGCSGVELAKYWMHWNLIHFSGTKMSKSLGNVISLRDFLSQQHPEIYKWMMLSVHYRSTAEFGDEAIERAISGLARVYSALALAQAIKIENESLAEKPNVVQDSKYEAELVTAWQKIEVALNDDFGTPSAFAVVFDLIRGFNAKNKRGMKQLVTTQSQCQQFIDFVRRFGSLLSLFQQPATEFLNSLDDQLLKQLGQQRSTINALVLERTEARAAKDFAKSDELRKKLTDMKIAVSDMPNGSFWEVMK